jgi:hypothetical protein
MTPPWLIEAVESAAEWHVIERLHEEATASISALSGTIQFEVKVGGEELGDWQWLCFGENKILEGLAAWFRKWPDDDEFAKRREIATSLRAFADRVEGK